MFPVLKNNSQTFGREIQAFGPQFGQKRSDSGLSLIFHSGSFPTAAGDELEINFDLPHTCKSPPDLDRQDVTRLGVILQIAQNLTDIRFVCPANFASRFKQPSHLAGTVMA